MDKEKKKRFLMVYQNLPLVERKNTIIVLEDETAKQKKIPISWDIAYIEIDQETPLGERILNKLLQLNLI